MKLAKVIIAGALVAASVGASAAEIAQELVRTCTPSTHAEDKHGWDMVCLGEVIGYTSASDIVLIGRYGHDNYKKWYDYYRMDEIKYRKIKGIFMQYVDRNPDTNHESASYIMANALLSQYPIKSIPGFDKKTGYLGTT